jgi:hypothetical protein
MTVKVLGLSRDADLDVNEPLRQLGLDSLMAVELRNMLGKASGHTLAATVTFEHPSIEALVEHLASGIFAEELGARVDAPVIPEVVPVKFVAEPAESFDDLEEDELARRLALRLDGIGS